MITVSKLYKPLIYLVVRLIRTYPQYEEAKRAVELEMEREAELRLPENRRMLKVCSGAEVERLAKAVYIPLGERYPEVIELLEEMREHDPLVEIEQMKHTVPTLASIKETVSAAQLDNLIGEDDYSKSIETMMGRIDPFLELNARFLPIHEQFYVSLARAIKYVSTTRDIGIEETVGDLQNMDEVLRIAVPIRREAEALLAVSQRYKQDAGDIARGVNDFMRKVWSVVEAKPVPSPEVLAAIQGATWNYKMAEFDRVYR